MRHVACPLLMGLLLAGGLWLLLPAGVPAGAQAAPVEPYLVSPWALDLWPDRLPASATPLGAERPLTLAGGGAAGGVRAGEGAAAGR